MIQNQSPTPYANGLENYRNFQSANRQRNQSRATPSDVIKSFITCGTLQQDEQLTPRDQAPQPYINNNIHQDEGELVGDDDLLI
jgi:hypothetical protein